VTTEGFDHRDPAHSTHPDSHSHAHAHAQSHLQSHSSSPSQTHTHAQTQAQQSTLITDADVARLIKERLRKKLKSILRPPTAAPGALGAAGITVTASEVEGLLQPATAY
jgi:hypothetical protein